MQLHDPGGYFQISSDRDDRRTLGGGGVEIFDFGNFLGRKIFVAWKFGIGLFWG